MRRMWILMRLRRSSLVDVGCREDGCGGGARSVETSLAVVKMMVVVDQRVQIEHSDEERYIVQHARE